MKGVLVSIQPKWCQFIADKKKVVEVRKTRPKLKTPFKVYIYCTKPSKKYQTICGCMVINTDELYRLPNGKIKHDWSGELMCCNGEYTKDNFLNGKVIGEFVCNRIDEYTAEFVNDGDCYEDVRRHWIDDDGEEDFEIITSNNRDNPEDCELLKNSCLSYAELKKYIGENFHDIPFYGWHISDLKTYDKPKELSEFFTPMGKRPSYMLERPPQSWCYVEVER